jgi:hypothetical protein
MSMSHNDQDIENLVTTMADMLGIDLAEANAAFIAMHLNIAFQLSSAFIEFPLDDETDPAPVFTP